MLAIELAGKLILKIWIQKRLYEINEGCWKLKINFHIFFLSKIAKFSNLEAFPHWKNSNKSPRHFTTLSQYRQHFQSRHTTTCGQAFFVQFFRHRLAKSCEIIFQHSPALDSHSLYTARFVFGWIGKRDKNPHSSRFAMCGNATKKNWWTAIGFEKRSHNVDLNETNF